MCKSNKKNCKTTATIRDTERVNGTCFIVKEPDWNAVGFITGM